MLLLDRLIDEGNGNKSNLPEKKKEVKVYVGVVER